MAFCSNCGKQVADGAKFCADCGTAITQTTACVGNTRKAVFDGEVHKCPHCGEVLKSFETVCPACNFELRGVNSSSAVKELADKIERVGSETQKINAIKNFPIPNTKEDIIEFMILASSNFDASYYATHLHEEDISDAWFAKIEQCYQKAKLAFGNHSDFERIESMYLTIKNECAEKKRIEDAKKFKNSRFRKVLIIFAVVSALCCAVAFNDGKVIAGIIAVVMFALFIVSLLMGSNVIKEKVANLRVIPAILAFVLFFVYFTLY